MPDPASIAASDSAVKIDLTLDCKGLACPLPVAKSRKAIDQLKAGQIMEVLATDKGSVPDFQAWSRQTGHQLLTWSEQGGVFRFLIRKR